MVAIAALTLEIHLDDAHSLKDKRQVIKSLKDKLRHRLNVSVAETDYQDQWKLSEIVVVAVASSRQVAENTLRSAEDLASRHLGGCLTNSTIEWLS
jgi:uncharacterized protein